MAPSNEELKAMASRVEYEVMEFRNAIRALSSLTNNDPKWNGAVESVLLHFRVLRAFFLNPKSVYKDDVLARDYIAKWNPNEAKVFADTKEDIDKRPAHLTTRRLLSAHNWPMAEMCDALEQLILDFRNRLSSSQREWFPHLLGVRPAIALREQENYSTTSPTSYDVLFIDSSNFRRS